MYSTNSLQCYTTYKGNYTKNKYLFRIKILNTYSGMRCHSFVKKKTVVHYDI